MIGFEDKLKDFDTAKECVLLKLGALLKCQQPKDKPDSFLHNLSAGLQNALGLTDSNPVNTQQITTIVDDVVSLSANGKQATTQAVIDLVLWYIKADDIDEKIKGELKNSLFEICGFSNDDITTIVLYYCEEHNREHKIPPGNFLAWTPAFGDAKYLIRERMITAIVNQEVADLWKIVIDAKLDQAQELAKMNSP